MGCDVVAPKITCWMFKVEFMYDPVYENIWTNKHIKGSKYDFKVLNTLLYCVW